MATSCLTHHIFWIYRDELPRRNKVCLMLPQGQNLVFASVCQMADEMCRQGLGGYNIKLGSCKSGEMRKILSGYSVKVGVLYLYLYLYIHSKQTGLYRI